MKLPSAPNMVCFFISAARFWPAAPCTTVREGGSLDLGLGMHIIMYGFRLLPVGVSMKITRITPSPAPSTPYVVLSRQSEGNHRGYLLRPIHAPDLLALCNPLPKVVQPPPKQGCPHGGFVVAAMLVVGAEVGGITTLGFGRGFRDRDAP